LGYTTQGWRPISVKIQPNIDARNGVGIAQIAMRASHLLSDTRPLRVNHSAASASATEPMARPIMRRNAQ
jgi:hypothetical protein